VVVKCALATTVPLTLALSPGGERELFILLDAIMEKENQGVPLPRCGAENSLFPHAIISIEN
jgi:hypothetical protein